MPGTGFRWRYYIRSFQHPVTEKRTQQFRYLVAKEYTDRSRDRRFERLLHQVKFVDSRRTSSPRHDLWNSKSNLSQKPHLSAQQQFAVSQPLQQY